MLPGHFSIAVLLQGGLTLLIRFEESAFCPAVYTRIWPVTRKHPCKQRQEQVLLRLSKQQLRPACTIKPAGIGQVVHYKQRNLWAYVIAYLDSYR